MMRWVTTAGFVLAFLLYLLLPCVAVSRDTQDLGPSGQGSIHISYTGGQLITQDPVIDVLGMFTPTTTGLRSYTENVAEVPAGVTIFAVITAVTLVAGAGATVLPKPRMRALVSTVMVVGGVALLVITEVMAGVGLANGVRDVGYWVAYLPEARGIDVQDRATEIVETTIGFWLTLSTLVMIAIANTGSFLTDRRRARESLPPGPGYGR